MGEFGAGNLLLKGENERSGQHGDAILFAFAVTDEDLAMVKVHVLNSQS